MKDEFTDYKDLSPFIQTAISRSIFENNVSSIYFKKVLHYYFTDILHYDYKEVSLDTKKEIKLVSSDIDLNTISFESINTQINNVNSQNATTQEKLNIQVYNLCSKLPLHIQDSFNWNPNNSQSCIKCDITPIDNIFEVSSNSLDSKLYYKDHEIIIKDSDICYRQMTTYESSKMKYNLTDPVITQYIKSISKSPKLLDNLYMLNRIKSLSSVHTSDLQKENTPIYQQAYLFNQLYNSLDIKTIKDVRDIDKTIFKKLNVSHDLLTKLRKAFQINHESFKPTEISRSIKVIFEKFVNVDIISCKGSKQIDYYQLSNSWLFNLYCQV